MERQGWRAGREEVGGGGDSRTLPGMVGSHGGQVGRRVPSFGKFKAATLVLIIHILPSSVMNTN